MTRTEPRSPTLPPLALTPEEAAAVVTALAARPDGPYAAAGATALQKVLDVLEPDPRRRAGLAASARWVSADSRRAAVVRSAVEEAVTRRRVVVLRYRDRDGVVSRRAVEAQLLARSGRHWFLVGWCREREALRWFREDRIKAVRATEEAAPRRDLTDLGGPPAEGHPAGRRLGGSPAPTAPPRLRVLPGGRA
ncbi:helix-turn-helix transcriptional regulator [Geodermatophilus sp. SYSU D00705]